MSLSKLMVTINKLGIFSVSRRSLCDVVKCLQVKLPEPISVTLQIRDLGLEHLLGKNDSFSLAILIGRRGIFCHDCVVRVSSAPLLSLFDKVHISSLLHTLADHSLCNNVVACIGPYNESISCF